MYHSRLIVISVVCPCITTLHLVEPDIISRFHLFEDWIDHNALNNSEVLTVIILLSKDTNFSAGWPYDIKHVLIHKIFLQDLCRCWWKNNRDFVSNAEEVKHWQGSKTKRKMGIKLVD